MNLNHPDLDDFEPALLKLHQTAFSSGIQALESEGLRLEDVEISRSARRRFVRGCHYGYELAQRQIAKSVIELELNIRDGEKNLKELRVRRDSGATVVEEQLAVLRDRQLVLRRLADAILYTMVAPDTWVLRRVILDLEIRRIDPSVLQRMAELASKRNRAERMKFALVADLTTVVQLGDLVEIDLSSETQKIWSLIEVKEGKINQILSEIIEKSSGDLTTREMINIRETLGRHAPKQAQRMLAQQKRLIEFENIVTTDHGIDAGTDKEIWMTSDPVSLESFARSICRLCRSAKEKAISTLVVDQCLRLVAISTARIQRVEPRRVAHVFYHLAYPSMECILNSPEREKEIERVKSMPPFGDLITHSMHSQWGEPLLIWPDLESVLDLVMGRVRVFVQLDWESFFVLAREYGITMTWITGEEAQELTDDSCLLPGSPSARGIRATLPDGNTQQLLSGMFARMVSDFVRPREILRTIKEFPPDPPAQATP